MMIVVSFFTEVIYEKEYVDLMTPPSKIFKLILTVVLYIKSGWMYIIVRVCVQVGVNLHTNKLSQNHCMTAKTTANNTCVCIYG